jgi:hypothetical protein
MPAGYPGPSVRVRKVASDTATPYQFAAKYSGDGDRWAELLDVNPSLRKVYPQFEVGATTPYGWGDSPDPDAPSGWGPSLLPWKIGQDVYLPAAWHETASGGVAGFGSSSWWPDLYTS